MLPDGRFIIPGSGADMALSAAYTAELLLKVMPLIQFQPFGDGESVPGVSEVTETLNRRRIRHYLAFAVLQWHL